MYCFSYVTTKGIVRDVNQDALMIKIASYREKEILVSAVCDGMGGIAGGEIASSFVITGVSEWFESQYPVLLCGNESILDIRRSLDELLHTLNDNINSNIGNKPKMGTTFTGMIIDPVLDKVLISHVGDTRLYKIYADRLEIVTTDHSVVAEEVRRGLLTPEEAAKDTRQNQITNCIGAGEKNRIYDYIIQSPETDCVYMLCSDGFRKFISENEIIEYLSPVKNIDNNSLHSNLEYLMNLNMERKESDNITAVAVKYKGGE